MQRSSCSFAPRWGAHLWPQVTAQPGEGGCTITITLPLQRAPLGVCSTQHCTGHTTALEGSSKSLACTVTITPSQNAWGTALLLPWGTASSWKLPWHSCSRGALPRCSTKPAHSPSAEVQHCCHLSCQSPRGGFSHWWALSQKQNKSLLFSSMTGIISSTQFHLQKSAFAW